MPNHEKSTCCKMPKRVLPKTFLLSLAIIIAAMSFGLSASAQTQTLVYIEPSALTLEPADKAVVEVRIDNAENLYGLEIHLEFDPALIQIVDSDQDAPDVQVSHGDIFDIATSFVVSNRVDNEQGTIIYAITQLAPSEPVDGNSVLLSLNLEAISLGLSELTLSSVILGSKAGESLAVESQNGQIIITQDRDETATPIPPTNTPIATKTSTPPSAATATYVDEGQATATPQKTSTPETKDFTPTATLPAAATKQETSIEEDNEVTQDPETAVQTAPTTIPQETNSDLEEEPVAIAKDDNNFSGGIIGLSIAGLGLVLFFAIKSHYQKS